MQSVKTITRIEGSRIYLRILEESDASPEYAAWLNDPIVNAYLETRDATVEDLKKYINSKRESPTSLFFGIFWKDGSENGRHIGNVKLEPINFEEGRATMGILIGDKAYWGRGVATEATDLVVNCAFTLLDLTEVHLGVISENAAAIRVYEKCGFKKYKVEPRAKNHNGVWYDSWWLRKQRDL